MFKFKRVPLTQMALTTANDAGQRRQVLIEQDTFTYGFFIILSAALTIATGAATTLKSRGSLSAAFDYIALNENGYDRVLADPRYLGYAAEMEAPSQFSNVRLTALAVATYQLREIIPVWFGPPTQKSPRETAFREAVPTAPTFVAVQLSNNWATSIVSGGTAVVTLNNITVSVQQMHSRTQAHLPLFQGVVRQLVLPVAQAQNPLIVPLMSDKYLSKVVVGGEAGNGLVNDIILAAAFRSDVRDYIGPQQDTWENIGRQAEIFTGGNVYDPPPNFAGILGQGSTAPLMVGLKVTDHGRLRTMIEPNETNLRLELNVQPTVVGAAPSQVRVVIFEWVRDVSPKSQPGGGVRYVCDPNPLPWTAHPKPVKAVAA